MNLRILLSCLACAAALTARAQFWEASTSFAPALASPQLPLEQRIATVTRQPDGKVVVTGYIERANGVTRANPRAPMRFNADGSSDISFNAVDSADQLFLQPSGKFVTAGGTRLNADGTRDLAFNASGALGTVLAMDEAGRLYTRIQDGTLIRTTTEGVDDGAFRGTLNGLAGTTIAPFADGSVAIATMQSTHPRVTVARMRADGSLDPNFKVYADAMMPQNFLGLVALPDGKVLVYGTGAAQFGICMQFVRLGLDGLPDYVYVGPGSNSTAPTPAEALTLAGVVYDLLKDANGTNATHVRTSFSTGTFSACLDVAATGVVDLATHAWAQATTFARYARAATGDLTIDPRPTILYQFDFGVTTRFLGESLLLGAPAAGGLMPLTYQWAKNGVPIAGATAQNFRIAAPTADDAGTYTVAMSNPHGTVTSNPTPVAIDTTPAPLAITLPLADRAVRPGSTLVWWTYASGNPYPTFEWKWNGGPVSVVRSSAGRQAASSVQIMDVQPRHTGIYEATATSGESSQRMTAVLGVLSDTKIAGSASEVGPDIVHSNKNVYDQVLLNGPAAAITADPNQITRASFVDLTGDIVQVEMAGAGTVSLVLQNPSDPAPAANYNQPSVAYMKGHVGIVVAGANETTSLTVFSVGRATALNQTLFREGVDYHGIADVSFIAISTTNGRFGGVRTGNVHYYADKGLTGFYAPGVQFDGPVYIGDIEAFDTARPVLVLTAAAEVRITGGDLHQENERAVQVGEWMAFRFTEGSTSHGDILEARSNAAEFEREGVKVTEKAAVRP